MDVKKIFGQNVRLYRKKNNFTQEQFAEKIEVTSKHLGVIERGGAFVSAELLQKISEILNISVSSLFYSNEEQNGSDSFLGKIDFIVEQELTKSIQTIKDKIRE